MKKILILSTLLITLSGCLSFKVIYSNHRIFKNGEYNIDTQFADAEYIAYADINLKFMGGMLCSN